MVSLSKINRKPPPLYFFEVHGKYMERGAVDLKTAMPSPSRAQKCYVPLVTIPVMPAPSRQTLHKPLLGRPRMCCLNTVACAVYGLTMLTYC